MIFQMVRDDKGPQTPKQISKAASNKKYYEKCKRTIPNFLEQHNERTKVCGSEVETHVFDEVVLYSNSLDCLL